MTGHSHTHPHTHDASKNIVTAFLLNFGFAIVELIGGLVTNSVAILSDAIHDFGDCISLGFAWALQKKSTQKGNNRYSYGYKRFSLLSSVFLCGILLVSSLFILLEAIERIAHPQAVNAQGMLWLAILGIVINGAAVLKLRTGDSLNERAVFLHMMEDVLGWLAVLIASIVMSFDHLPILDPLLSICITLWVLFNVYRNLHATFKILLQRTPEEIDMQQLTSEIEALPDVVSIHDLHVWSLDGLSHVMTLHVVAPDHTEHAEFEALKQQIRDIGNRHAIGHVTIEFETPSDEPHCLYATHPE